MGTPKKRHKAQRLDIHLPPAMLAWLRLEAQRLDIPMGEVIRRLLHKEIEG